MSEKTNPQEQEMTPEQMKEMRAKMHAYYEEQLPLVRLQSEYEKSLADIEEARARRITMSIRIAELMARQNDEEPIAKPERKLKTDA
jgi:hypothetical protein